MKMGMGISGTGGGFILLDTLERNWEFPAHKSGTVVLAEFMTTTCPYSRGVVPVLTDFQSRYGSVGLQVIAVACDNLPQKQRLEASAKYARDNNLNYAIFVEPGDEAGGVRNRYNVKGYPAVVLLDATGAVLWQGHPNQRAELETAIKRALGK
jgi:thiol-disulfide isomerase/thioredoxin